MDESESVVLRSASNPTVRHLVRLREGRYRRKSGRVIVDGWRETRQAIASGLKPIGLYVSETDFEAFARAVPHEQADYVIGHPAARDKLTIVSDPIMQRISYGQSPRGVVGQFERPDYSLTNLRLHRQHSDGNSSTASPLVLVLDRIEKPGNIGAVFRCADAAGVDAVLLSDCQDPLNPNSIRNSLGAVFRVPKAIGTQSEVAKFLADEDFCVLAARVQSSKSLWEVRWDGPTAVVLGNEAEGLGDRWLTLKDRSGKSRPIDGIRIPMAGQVDSLNVSVSAAVITFEARRPRIPDDREFRQDR